MATSLGRPPRREGDPPLAAPAWPPGHGRVARPAAAPRRCEGTRREGPRPAAAPRRREVPIRFAMQRKAHMATQPSLQSSDSTSPKQERDRQAAVDPKQLRPVRSSAAAVAKESNKPVSSFLCPTVSLSLRGARWTTRRREGGCNCNTRGRRRAGDQHGGREGRRRDKGPGEATRRANKRQCVGAGGATPA